MEILERAGEGVVAIGSGRGHLIDGLALSKQAVLTFSAQELLEEQDGYWTVRDVAVGIFGSGADPKAAVADFRAALREHLDVLERQDSLSADLQAQLEYLRRRIA